MMGDTMSKFANDAIKSMDGSWIAIQTDKPSYYAGETITGWIVTQVNSPRQCDKVLLKITIKENIYWDEEIVRTIEEGEGENRKVRHVYEHHQHFAKDKWLKEVIVVSQLPHILAPGQYKYPFSYTLRNDLPGCAKFTRETDSADPAWRSMNKKNVINASVVYSVRACLDVNGLFSKDLKCKQELVVNSAFDWSKMQPAHGENGGEVKLCCCIPRGRVSLIADFDKAAYASGETAQIKAQIFNQSKEDVKHMVVKLMRFIELTDSQGRKRHLTDTVASATYPGVPKEQPRPVVRDLPLPLRNESGHLLPGTRSRKLTISYRFDVECDLFCAPDIEVHLPVVIYQPAPAVWGLAAMGITMPAGLGITVPQMPIVQPMVPAVQPIVPAIQPMVQVQTPMVQVQAPMVQVQTPMSPMVQPNVQISMGMNGGMMQQQNSFHGTPLVDGSVSVNNPAMMVHQASQQQMNVAVPGMSINMNVGGMDNNAMMGVNTPGMSMGVNMSGGMNPGPMAHQNSFHAQNSFQGNPNQMGMSGGMSMGNSGMNMGANMNAGMGMGSPMGGAGGFGGMNGSMTMTSSSSSSKTVNGQLVEANYSASGMHSAF